MIVVRASESRWGNCNLLVTALLTAKAEDSSRASLSGDLAVGNADAGAGAQAEACDLRCVRTGLCRQKAALSLVIVNVVAVLLIVGRGE